MVIRPEDVDLSPWLGAPEDDQTEEGRFRRELARITREVKAAAANRAAGVEPGVEVGAASRPGPGFFDIADTTPALLDRATARLARRLRSTPARSGTPAPRLLPVPERALVELARSGAVGQAVLARRLGVPPSTLSRMVREHEGAGRIRRGLRPGDRRQVRLELTEAGFDRAVEVVERVRRADRALLGPLSAAERDDLRRLLRRAGAGWR